MAERNHPTDPLPLSWYKRSTRTERIFPSLVIQSRNLPDFERRSSRRSNSIPSRFKAKPRVECAPPRPRVLSSLHRPANLNDPTVDRYTDKEDGVCSASVEYSQQPTSAGNPDPAAEVLRPCTAIESTRPLPSILGRCKYESALTSRQ